MIRLNKEARKLLVRVVDKIDEEDRPKFRAGLEDKYNKIITSDDYRTQFDITPQDIMDVLVEQTIINKKLLF